MRKSPDPTRASGSCATDPQTAETTPAGPGGFRNQDDGKECHVVCITK